MTGPSATIHLSAEIAPWSRKGGLGDAVAGLTGALAVDGETTAVWSPLYEHTQVDAPRTPGEVIISPGGRRVPTWTRRPAGVDVEVDFVELPFPFAFDAVHTDTTPTHQEGLDPRNLMFGQVCAAMLGRRPSGVCFTHDWHGGAVHLYRHLCPGWRFVHVIHNFEYHGPFSWGPQVDRVLGPQLGTAQHLVAGTSPSFAAMAVRASDAVLTVSPAYAAELCAGRVAHPYLGLLRERHVEGYLNGYDDQVWDPRTDPLIVADFSGPGPDRNRNRTHLATRLGFTGERPIVVMVSRLIEQKGIDVLAGSPPDVEVAATRMDAVLDCGVDLVLCGDPDGGPGGPLDRALAGVAHLRPGRFAYLPGYDDTTGHRLLAGADILLHPSRFEPCGLTQLHALAYGVIPIVHPVGGLGDTVPHNLDPDLGPVGVHLRDLTIDAVVEAVTACAAAISLGAGRLVHRAMSQPRPWKDRKDAYVALVEALRSR